MTGGDYLLGAVLFAFMLGCCSGAAWLLVSRRMPWLGTLERVLALGLIVTTAVVGVHLVPLILGILAPGWVVAGSVALLLGCLRLRSLAPADHDPAAEAEAEPVGRAAQIGWGLALLAAAIGTVAAAALLSNQAPLTFRNIDTVTFHLPNVARWIQTGSLWQIDQFIPQLSHGYYPNTGDVVLLSAVLPWDNDFAVRLVIFPFLLLTGAAVYALARELGAPKAASLSLAAAMAFMPLMGKSAVVRAMPDVILFFGFAAAALFLLRHARRGHTSDLVLAGLGLGLAFGTKWYGVTSAIVVIGIWAAAMLLARRPVRAVLRQGGALTALTFATGGIWLLRNLVEEGNPVYPVKIALGGLTLFDAPPDPLRDQVGFTLAHYATDPGIWTEYLFSEIQGGLGIGWVLCAAGTVLAVVALALRARPRIAAPDARRMAVAAAAVVLAGVYAITPYTALGFEDRPIEAGANTRYAVPALLLAAALTAWSAGAWPRLRLVIQLGALVAVIDGVRLGFERFDASSLAKAVAAICAVALAAYLVKLLATGVRARRPSALGAAAAALVLALVVGLAGGRALEQRFNDDRYLALGEPAIDWVLERPDDVHRVGLAGSWSIDGLFPVLPVFGPRLRNEVEYVGRFDRGMLQKHRDERGFRDDLAAGDFDALIVGRGLEPPDATPEAGWAEAAGYREVARSRRLIVLVPPPR